MMWPLDDATASSGKTFGRERHTLHRLTSASRKQRRSTERRIAPEVYKLNIFLASSALSECHSFLFDNVTDQGNTKLLS